MDEQCYPQLFAKCGKPLQVDGTLGVAAGITEMLVQSHEGVIDLLPALPDEWSEGRLDGICALGGFELDMKWKNKIITEVEILSKAGNVCRIDKGGKYKVLSNGKRITSKTNENGSVEFNTVKGCTYTLRTK
jgi:alpha-L-fucosidase 2